MSSSGPWFNIKRSSFQYRKSHCGDKTIFRPSYLHNGISYTGKMTSLYWIGALAVKIPACSQLTVSTRVQKSINAHRGVLGIIVDARQSRWYLRAAIDTRPVFLIRYILHAFCRCGIKATTGTPLYWHGWTFIPARISNYIHYQRWDKLSYPFLNFKVATFGVGLKNNFFLSTNYVCYYWAMLRKGPRLKCAILNLIIFAGQSKSSTSISNKAQFNEVMIAKSVVSYHHKLIPFVHCHYKNNHYNCPSKWYCYWLIISISVWFFKISITELSE